MSENEIAKNTNAISSRPSFLPAANESQAGTELLTEFVIPPRIKMIQALSSSELREQFKEGSCVLVPQNQVLDVPFSFTPIFFFPEWITWNPRGLSHLPTIRDKTTDPNHPLVKKCRDPELWKEPCPEDPNNPKNVLRHCEHLNFVIIIHGVEGMEQTPVILSFSRAEHSKGKTFITMLKMRNADIFGCVFDAVPGHRKNSEGEWHGLDIRQPAECEPWITDEDQYNFYKELHNEYAKHHASGNLVASVEEDSAEPAVNTSDVDTEM